MASHTLCTNSLCPLVGQCLRATAEPTGWQSYAFYRYTVDVNGVVCEEFKPAYKIEEKE